jgi:N-glycosylase/DNA lyase
MPTGPIPILPKLFAMIRSPVCDKPQRPWRELAREHEEVLDLDRRLVVAVAGVEVWTS